LAQPEPSTKTVDEAFAPARLPLWQLSNRAVTWPPEYRIDFNRLDRLSNAVVAETDIAHDPAAADAKPEPSN